MRRGVQQQPAKKKRTHRKSNSTNQWGSSWGHKAWAKRLKIT